MRRIALSAVLMCVVLALSCKGPTGPAGPDIASLNDPSILPGVIYDFPGNGSRGPYTDFNNRFTVRFNKIMNRTAMKHAAAITSPRGDVRLDTTAISAVNTDGFTFVPQDSRGPSYKFLWKIGETYTLRIGTTADDVNGNRLTAPFVCSAIPEPAFRVVSISPLDGATDIATSWVLNLTFNSPVDSGIAAAIHITPRLTGQWRYAAGFPAADSSAIHFAYQGALADTVYTVSVDPAAKDKYGNSIMAGYTSSFRTVAFRVTSVSPNNDAVSAGLTAISVGFPVPIDTSSVPRSFSISPAINGSFHFSSNPVSFTFNPVPRLMTNTTYSVTIGTGIASAGGMHPAVPYVFSFTTLPFTVSSTTPTDGGFNVSAQSTIVVRMTDMIDTASVRSAFRIAPPVAGSLILRDSSSQFTFVPAAGLLSGTVYTCTLGSGLTSSRGDSLGQPASFAFYTASFGVTGTSPGDGSTGISINTPLTITLNAPVDTAGIGGAISIVPPAPVNISAYEGGSSVTVTPLPEFMPDTVYTVTVLPSLRSTNGSSLSGASSFSFQTAPFGVFLTIPSNGTVGVARTTSITLAVNAVVASDSVTRSFSISPSVGGSISWGSNATSTTITFYPSTPLDSLTQYTVSLSTALRTKGGRHLEVPYSFKFTTGE